MSERISDGEVVPEGEVLPIRSVSAFVAVDPQDMTEGIPAIDMGGTAMPLIGADQEMIEKLLPQARRIAQQLGLKVSLVRFSHREVLIEDVLEGD